MKHFLLSFLQDLISHLLVVDVKKRYDTDDILEHPWIKVCSFILTYAQRGCAVKRTTGSFKPIPRGLLFNFQCRGFGSLPPFLYGFLNINLV